MCSSFEENYRVHCPAGANSWCTYQLDIANNTHLHKHGKGLPKEAIKHIKSIFVRLSADELLGKCLHGKTQNQNESYNSLIWKRTPKDKFVKQMTFEIAVYDSAAHFNVGNLATLLIYDRGGGGGVATHLVTDTMAVSTWWSTRKKSDLQLVLWGTKCYIWCTISENNLM